MEATPTPPDTDRTPRGRKRVRGTADVLCDSTGRIGALSYLIPATLEVCIGDAVEVPFGQRTSRGLVLGVGDPARATRAVLSVLGPRAAPGEIALARDLARWNFSPFSAIAGRLAPRTRRGNPPYEAGPVKVTEGTGFVGLGRTLEASQTTRRLLACAPGVSQPRLAALEAAEIAAVGQVLILCPTTQDVTLVLAEFVSGAARMDNAPKGADPSAWKAFVDGTLQVAVATRTAALWAAPRLAGIVVVDEDHPGHVEATQPHTNARDVATLRTQRLGASLVLLSSNPSPLALGAKVKIFAVGTPALWPTTRVVNRPSFARNRLDLPGAVRSALIAARQAGVVPVVVASTARSVRRCKGCRMTLTCTECESHSCTHLRGRPCPRCRSTESRLVGWDPERVAKAVGRPAKVVLPHQLRTLRDVGLVIVYDADPFLTAPGLLPDRWAADVFLAAARAAGPAGTVLVVTCEPGAAPYDDLVTRHDLVRFAKRTWNAAKDAQLPPFGRLVTVKVAGPTPPRTTGWPGTVFGPRPVGKDFELLVRCSDADLAALAPCLERLRKRHTTRVSVS